jgi:hypothetical protein
MNFSCCPLVYEEVSVIDASIAIKTCSLFGSSFDLLTVNLPHVLLNFLFCFGPIQPCSCRSHSLRCPGNVGYWVVCSNFFSQRLSLQYAGNWDPKSKKALVVSIATMDFKQYFLTRNMKVLVYGVWDGQSSKYLSFYGELFRDGQSDFQKNYTHHRFCIVGALVKCERIHYTPLK